MSQAAITTTLTLNQAQVLFLLEALDGQHTDSFDRKFLSVVKRHSRSSAAALQRNARRQPISPPTDSNEPISSRLPNR